MFTVSETFVGPCNARFFGFVRMGDFILNRRGVEYNRVSLTTLVSIFILKSYFLFMDIV